MADLDIQKKKRNPILWIVLALLAVVAIIWIIADDDDDDVDNTEIVAERATGENEPGTAQTAYNLNAEAQKAIDEFVQFSYDLGEIEIDHETTHKGLTLLADALAALTNNTDEKVSELRQQADELLKNPMEGDHADKMHDAFVTAANIIDNKLNTLDEESAEVMEAAEAVDGEDLATNQKDAIKNFFNAAANALNSLD